MTALYKKIVLMPIYIILCILYLGIVYFVINHHTTKARALVTVSHNQHYKPWLHHNFTPILTYINNYRQPPSTQNSIMEFTINDLIFYIPQKYLWQTNRNQNGDITSVHLILKYPEMTAISKQDDYSQYNLNIIIASTKYWKSCQTTNICHQISQQAYENWTNIRKGKVNKIEKLYRLLEGNLTAYKINNSEEFLLRGNPLRPELWFSCNGGKYSKIFYPICETTFNYNDKIYLNYSFDRHFLLMHHEDIKTSILEKVSSFQPKTSSYTIN